MDGNLNLTLELTKEDMGQFLVEKDKNKTHIVLSLVIYVAMNLLYGIIGWLLKVPVNMWSGIIITLVALIAPMFFVQTLLFKKGQENFEKMQEQFPLITLSIDDKMIYVTAGDTRSKYEWKDVFGLKEYGSSFCILVNKTTGMMIPKRLLEDNESQILRDLSGSKLDKKRK